MILETIAEATRKRVAAEKEKCSLAEMKEKATAMNPDTGFPFEQALKKPGMSFICEVKKASPSKGIIAEDFPYLEIAKEYEAAGASAISCLTEPEYFKGDKRYLKKIAETVSTICSSTLGPATVPSFVTCPTIKIGIPIPFASCISTWVDSLTCETLPGAEDTSSLYIV